MGIPLIYRNVIENNHEKQQKNLISYRQPGGQLSPDYPLSKGQLKRVIEERKVITAKFLDKGDTLHCFFGTLDSFGGKESWKDGQAHFQYISDKWGFQELKLLQRLRLASI